MTVLAGKRILVVEDEAVIAAMIEDMLVELGATVIGPAATISNGLTLAGAGHIDAAVLDVNVRGERIEPVASLLSERSVPIVFASGYGDTGVPMKLIDIALAKPFKLDDLGRALVQVLARSHGQAL